VLEGKQETSDAGRRSAGKKEHSPAIQSSGGEKSVHHHKSGTDSHQTDQNMKQSEP
jgi:hypothetical protein